MPPKNTYKLRKTINTNSNNDGFSEPNADAEVKLFLYMNNAGSILGGEDDVYKRATPEWQDQFQK